MSILKKKKKSSCRWYLGRFEKTRQQRNVAVYKDLQVKRR